MDLFLTPKRNSVEPQVSRGHAPAQQLKRVLLFSDGGNAHLLNYADEVLEQREVYGAFDKAPHAPIA